MKIFTLAALISLAIAMPALAENKVAPEQRALMLKRIDDMLPVNADGKNLAKIERDAWHTPDGRPIFVSRADGKWYFEDGTRVPPDLVAQKFRR